MTDTERTRAFRTLASELDGIDVEVYTHAGRDPLDPIIGAGRPEVRVAVFGRDPGRHEVVHGMPFVGKGGQLIRKGLYRHLHGRDLPDFETSLRIGRAVFWANTVPYKPIGNKAWGIRVQRRFQAPMADLLVHGWRGRDVLTMGRGALLWFGLQDKATKARLQAHWQRDDAFERTVEATLRAPDGTGKAFRLHPLPHPSPLNATWHGRFPGLLARRLDQLELTEDA